MGSALGRGLVIGRRLRARLRGAAQNYIVHFANAFPRVILLQGATNVGWLVAGGLEPAGRRPESLAVVGVGVAFRRHGGGVGRRLVGEVVMII